METSSSRKNIPFSLKLAVIAMIMASTLAYSIVRKRQIDALTSKENFLILKKLPEFSLSQLEGVKEPPVTNENIFNGDYEAVLIHFWGTWCAPCEAELPEFLEFVEFFRDKKVKAVLLAVQDNDKLIKKFLKRFGDLPENIEVVHDPKGESMLTFGTVKVPETYLFSKSGKNLNKYVGPQDWKQKSYKDRMNFYLSSISGDQKSYKVESH